MESPPLSYPSKIFSDRKLFFPLILTTQLIKYNFSLKLIFYLFIITALAALVNIYVSALNTPGTVPSVQSAWETFVHTKCTEAKLAALRVYESVMTSELDGLLPCDSDNIRQVQERAIGESMRIFQEETVGVSASSSEKYLDELMVRLQHYSVIMNVLIIKIFSHNDLTSFWRLKDIHPWVVHEFNGILSTGVANQQFFMS